MHACQQPIVLHLFLGHAFEVHDLCISLRNKNQKILDQKEMFYRSSILMRLFRRSSVVMKTTTTTTTTPSRLQHHHHHHHHQYTSISKHFFATAATMDQNPQPSMEAEEEEVDDAITDFDRAMEPFNFTRYVYDSDLRHAPYTIVNDPIDRKKREYKRARETRDPLELRLIEKYYQAKQEGKKKYSKKKKNKLPPIREELYHHAHKLPKLRPVEKLIVTAEQVQFRSDAATVKRPERKSMVDSMGDNNETTTADEAGVDDSIINSKGTTETTTETIIETTSETWSDQQEVVYLPPKYDSDDEYDYDEASLNEYDEDGMEYPSLEGSLESDEGRPITLPKLQVITTCMPFDNVTNTKMPSTDDVDQTMQIFVKPLLIIDPEGILCHRIINNPEKQPLPIHAYRTPLDTVIENSNIIPRPDLEEFLDYLSQHFCLAVWSAHRSVAVNELVKALFPPRIGRKLLFMWSRNYCHAQRFRGRMQRGSDKRTHIFRKSLADVWMQFPIWNESNTLVLDSWPYNMLTWEGNALHPPGMNGRKILRLTHEPIFADAGIESDEVNAQRQREFFEKLVQHWKDHPSIYEWYTEDGFQADPHIENGLGMIQFLEEHGRGHMGWQPQQTTAEIGQRLWKKKPIDPFKNPRLYYI
jgi:hypothetical protein